MSVDAARVRIDGDEAPVGVNPSLFRVEWPGDVELDGERARVEIRDASGEPVWTSTRMSVAPGFTTFAGPSLLPQTRYAVVVTTDLGSTIATSEFVTGLGGRPWVGRWIAAPGDRDLPGIPVVGPREVTGPPAPARPERPVPEFFRSFDLTLDPTAVYVLRASAVGVSDILVNGRPVSAELLSPGWTDISRTLTYQSVDIGALLRSGSNLLHARVADGWALGNLCWFGTGHYADERALLLQVEEIRADGMRVVVGSDRSWSVRSTPLGFADLQDGSDVVVGAESSDPVGVVSAHPRVGELVGRIAPPIVPISRFDAQVVTDTEGGLVVDFGQNLVGWVELDVTDHDGSAIEVRHAEVLDDSGHLYTESLRSADARDGYTFADARPVTTTLRPHFTVHGFRYASISGLSSPGAVAIRAVAVSADLEATAKFSCSDPDLTRLHENVLWSARGNFLSVPTDCPQRDERMGWTGDAQVFAPTAAINFRVLEFFRKWLRDVRDATRPDGAVPNVAPDILSTSLAGSHVGSAGWGDAIVFLPWEMYQAYGDTAILRENLEAIDGWLGYLSRNSREGLRPAEGFGDWLAFDETPVDLVSTAFFARAAEVAARCAAVLGDPREAEWASLARRVRSAFRAEFLVGGLPTVPTQAALALALRFGLVPDEHRSTAEQALADTIVDTGHLTTGFLATPHLLPVLTMAGREDIAMDLLLNDRVPSWLHPVRHGGATTVWERWDSWTPERGFADPEMNSFNHYAYGAVDEWMCDRIGGVRRTAAAYAEVEVSPLLDARLEGAAHSRATPYGEVGVRWERTGEEVAMVATVPRGMTARFRTPAGYRRLAGPSGMLPAGTTEITLVRAA